jgi:hypothetical protein
MKLEAETLLKDKVKVKEPCLVYPFCLNLPPSHSPEACLPLFRHFLIICNFIEGIKDKRDLEGNWIYI